MMFRVRLIALACVLAAGSTTLVLAQARPSGWQLPPDADQLENPLAVNGDVLTAGKRLYEQKCQRCHGESGIGDGPDSNPENRPEMDLTNPKRAGRNPDGIVYHKVLSGRGRPEMPAFKDQLTPEQIWTVVAYTQTLRKR